MPGGVVYRLGPAGYYREPLDFTRPQFYHDQLFVHAFGDIRDGVGGDDHGLLMVRGTVFYSSNRSMYPRVNNLWLYTDGVNGAWTPDPAGSVPEYVGVRFPMPLRVTGFQFSSGVLQKNRCPGSVTPCAYPTDFRLSGSNDGLEWTELLAVSDFSAMRHLREEFFPHEDPSAYASGVFLSDRLEVANDRFFLFLRLDVEDFCPNIYGDYNISELLFYGLAG